MNVRCQSQIEFIIFLLIPFSIGTFALGTEKSEYGNLLHPMLTKILQNLFKNVHRDPCLHTGMVMKERKYCRLFLMSLCPVLLLGNSPFLLYLVISGEHKFLFSIHSSSHQSNPVTSGWITVACVTLLPIHQDESELFFFPVACLSTSLCVWMDGWMQQVELFLAWPRSITTEWLLLSNKNFFLLVKLQSIRKGWTWLRDQL